MQLTVWTYEGPPHVGAMRIAAAMKNVHYVLHAPQGDTYADLLFTMIERRNTRPPVTYTTFQARDLGGDTAELFKNAVSEAFERFKPACQNDDLQRCSQQEIVNAYDNALLYTDHLLASLVTRLQQRAKQLDSVMIYVSDHGESLGENRLFLHGMPYAIAPDVQKQVPMVMWTSAGFGQSARLDKDCLRQRAQQGASHDHLFHSVLGLLDVRTALYERALDLTADCRRRPPGAPS